MINIQGILHGENRKKIITGIIIVVLLLVLGTMTLINKKNRTSGTGDTSTETQILTDINQLEPRESVASLEAAHARLALPTITLSADTTTVAPGQSAVIKWASKNATSCADGVGNPIRLEGGYSITPKEDYTLDIVCTGPKGTTAESLTISIITAPLINLSAYPPEVAPGQQSFITWDTSNAMSCLDSTGKTLRLNDTLTITPQKQYTFEIRCSGEKGSAKKSVVIAVNSAGKYAVGRTPVRRPGSTNPSSISPSKVPVKIASYVATIPGERTVVSVGPGPKITLTFDPDTLAQEDAASLFSWTVQNATSCVASTPTGIKVASATNSALSRNLMNSEIVDAGIFKEMNGSTQIKLYTGKTSARITFKCVGEGGISTASNTLSLDSNAIYTEAPEIELSANPSLVSAGGTSEVTWTTTKATTCKAKALSGQAQLFNETTGAYSKMYEAWAGIGLAGKMNVSPSLSNSSVPGGYSNTDLWKAANVGPHTLFGKSSTPTPYSPATITFSCKNSFGKTDKSVTVNVIQPEGDCGTEVVGVCLDRFGF